MRDYRDEGFDKMSRKIPGVLISSFCIVNNEIVLII